MPLLNGDANLSIAKEATLNLDYDGEATFKTLKIGGLQRGANVYSSAQGPKIVKNRLSGNGALRILEGNDPGLVIIIR